MSPLRQLLLSCLAFSLLMPALAPAAAGALSDAGPPPCPPHVEDLTTGGSQTANAAEPLGSDDAQWHVVQTPQGSVSSPARSIPTHVSWDAPSPFARWVNPWMPNTPYADNNLAGGTTSAPLSTSPTAFDYVYTVTFFLNELSYDTFTLDLHVAADDFVQFELNGKPLVAFTTGPHAFHPKQPVLLIETAGSLNLFKDGVNTLSAHVQNNLIHTGLLVEGFVRSECNDAPCLGYAGLLNTGMGTAPGQDDPRWTVDGPPAKGVVAWWTWAIPTSGSWINPTGSNPVSPGTYTYAITFNIPCLTLVACDLQGVFLDFAADDHVSFRLNGNFISPTFGSAWASKQHVERNNCSGDLLVGQNVLEAIVTNTGGASGLLVEGYFVF